MSSSLRHFGQSLGQASVSSMAAKLGLTRPLSVRDMIRNFGTPVEPKLHLDWLEGDFPKHPVQHPPDSTSVPSNVEGGVTLAWDDPGKGSPRTATAWTLHFKTGNGPDQIFRQTFPSLEQPLDFATVYSWSVAPENEFGPGVPSSSFNFVTAPSGPPLPPPPPVAPSISVSSSGSGQTSIFVVTGSGFLPNHNVRIRVVDDALKETDFNQSSDGSGKLNATLRIPCISRLTVHISATDGRPSSSDLTGVLFSNTFNIPCP
jgi:hypothetical protein